MVDDGSISKAIKMQGYALFLMGNFPQSLKKKILFKMLTEIEIRLSQDELKELEEFYKPDVIVASVGSASVGRVEEKRWRPMRYCSSCARPVSFNDKTGVTCPGCSKFPTYCECEPIGTST